MITTKGYKIKQTSEYSYIWKVNGDYKYEIYFSVSKTKILNNCFYDDELNVIIFSAETVETLSDYLDKGENRKMNYLHAIKLIHNITKQMNYLYENNFSFYGFDLDDILVINQSLFFVASSNYLLPIVDKTNILFYNPIKMPYFSNPELFKLTSLPYEINYKCSYYSLGAIVVYCLLNNYLLVGNEIKSEKEIENSLSSIKHTKMYWFLKRCLITICDKRILLFF
jgi:hypothetical protein